ncbi:competence type IV pilus ATPase ComGA [Lactiplantibacillus sp. WILCCON 0030]|uniref:Competence type IV pilus ATPase ComGA n=1 Tax=Lactiplantibacillus brownii TaxID=3069269 RepID=A0ABU1A9R1_9LACO|nr:competence type IV pilus ATPase ComGA [Lactiplantibacillus brownii]MDQ7937679.1 competence type IV pilus ATPase ComGA [Lactiplantibacillus brownii]
MSVETQLSTIIQAAVDQQASDIYWLPTANEYQILLQAAGELQTLMTLEAVAAQQLINHIKYRSNMAISDHRRPQLGAMSVVIAEEMLNLRISAVGDFLGRESLVVRLLYQSRQAALQYLIPSQRVQLQNLMQETGLILFSGPMGAGKTSTMYDLVRQMGRQQVVMTIEDPVEIYEPKFLQLQVNAAAQMTYHDLLKVGLRHHPEIFIIGEIRDAETAQIAVQAALSGHLVLSTIHARGVYGVVPRLQQLGIDVETLRQALTAASYQRLLPLATGGQAAYFDLITTKQPLQAADPAQMMTTEWGRQLEGQQALGRITKQTLARYRGH